jgi:hypothetical protein
VRPCGGHLLDGREPFAKMRRFHPAPLTRRRLAFAIAGIGLAMVLSGCKGRIDALGAPIPEYIGTWISTRHGTSYIIVLDKNGRFTSDHVIVGHAPQQTGQWGYKDGSLRWRYDRRVSRYRDDQGGVDEINKVRTIDLNRFVLTEDNGSETRFQRQGT